MADKRNSKKKKKNKQKLIPWISKHHRMVIVNDQTFIEERSWRLSPVNVILVGGGSIFLAIIFTMLLLKYTPLGGLIIEQNNPIADNSTRRKMKTLFKQLDTINTKIANNANFMDNIKRLTTEEFEYEKDMQREEGSILTETGTRASVEGVPEKSEAIAQIQANVASERELGSLVHSIFLEDEDRIDRDIFVSPLKGVVSRTFEPNEKHYGTDVVAPKGTIIRSTRAGTVIMSTWSADTGHMIGVQHDHNLISWYKHNSARLKKIGDRVEGGEAIAIIGNTGEMTSGSHLHFELWYNGQPVDPQKYIDF